MPAKPLRMALGSLLIQKQYGFSDEELVEQRRDLRYLDEFLALDDVQLTEKQAELLDVIRKIYEQQRFMFENKTHSAENRIVSISQPFIRPIVRGKASHPLNSEQSLIFQ